MIVTKAQLDALRAQREQVPQPSLRPDNNTVQAVHEDVAAEREKQTVQGDKILKDAQKTLQQDLEKARQQGYLKAQYNQHAHTPACKP